MERGMGSFASVVGGDDTVWSALTTKRRAVHPLVHAVASEKYLRRAARSLVVFASKNSFCSSDGITKVEMSLKAF